MTESLPTLKAIANHLTRRGGEVMIGRGRAAMRARIVDFPGHVNIHFRSSRVVRVSLALPAKVDATNRELFASRLAQLNRRRLGAGFVMTRANVVFVTQIPTEPDGGVEAHQLDRAIELAIAACREALPGLERMGDSSLAAGAPALSSLDEIAERLRGEAIAAGPAPIALRRSEASPPVDLYRDEARGAVWIRAPLGIDTARFDPRDLALALAEVNVGLELFGVEYGAELAFVSHVFFDADGSVSPAAIDRLLAGVDECAAKTAAVIAGLAPRADGAR